MVYEQELYNQFTYKQDRPYFHSFPGDVSVYLCYVMCVLPNGGNSLRSESR